MKRQLPHFLLTWLAERRDEQMQARLRANTCTGRPCGSERFVALFEKVLGQLLRLRRSAESPRRPRKRRSRRPCRGCWVRNEVTVPSFGFFYQAGLAVSRNHRSKNANDER